MDEATLISEMTRSRDAIAALTGEMPSVVCYPEGTRSELSVAVARRYYQYGLLMNGYTWNTSDDPFYVCLLYTSRRSVWMPRRMTACVTAKPHSPIPARPRN